MKTAHLRSFSFVLLLVLVLTILVSLLSGARSVYAEVHPKIRSSFSVPGGQVRGLAWGNNNLWLADANQQIYRLSANGIVQQSFATTIDVTDLSWYENSLWAHDGNTVYQLDSAGKIMSTIEIGYWASSGMEWAEGALFVNDYNSGKVYKHDQLGKQLLSWDTTFGGHPEDMAYDGIGLWIADSCEGENGLWRYSLQGVAQDSMNLNAIESCDSTSDRALTWDGQYLWYSSNTIVYQLDITGLFVDTQSGLRGLRASNAVWGDYDGDGDLDIAAMGLNGPTPSTKIYRNDGINGFTDIQATIANVYNGSIDWGDYDNDGLLDLLLTGCADASCSTRMTRIYRNQGAGLFSNLANAGLPGIADSDTAWGDYDNDGDLDILLLGHNGSKGLTRIYRNNRDGTFTDILEYMANNQGPITLGLYDGSVAWGDYDNDGDLDALLVGCYTATCFRTSLGLYRNDGNDVFILDFMDEGARSSSVAWGDYDNDGDLDIVLTGSIGWAAYETCKTIIYQNNTGAFTKIGTLIVGACQGSVAWGDYDNDGDLDIVLAGDSLPSNYQSRIARVYRNDGNSEFIDIKASLQNIAHGSVVWGDYDNDSQLDILLTGDDLALVYRNQGTSTNTAATAPQGLRTSTCQLTSCVLLWNASVDAQTPVQGLNYNIRVGTTPGGTDIMAPMALSNNAYRLLPALGNARQNAWHLHGLHPGSRYYWSVQAIDTAYRGSPFAAEASFVADSLSIEDDPITDLVAQATPNPTSPGSLLSFHATITAGTNVSYSWDFGDGSQSSGLTSRHSYTAPGNYTATVTASNALGTASASVRVIVQAQPQPSFRISLPLALK